MAISVPTENTTGNRFRVIHPLGPWAVVALGVAVAAMAVPRLVDAVDGGARDMAGTREEQMLASSPLHPRQWLDLAQRRAASGDRRGALAALRLSILAGAVEPSIQLRRLRLALTLMGDMDGEERTMLERQVRLSYILYPSAVFAMGEQSPLNRELVHQVMGALNDADYERISRIHALH